MTTEDNNARTIVSLRDYIERRLDDHCLLNENRFESLEEAFRRGLNVLEAQLQASREVTDARLLVQNEWRGSLEDARAQYAAKSTVYDLEKLIRSGLEAANNRTVTLELRLVSMSESTTMNGVELKSIKEWKSSMNDWRSNMEGRFTAYVAALGIVIVLVGFVLKFL